MSNRLSQEKANAIAAEYTTNGFRAVDALLAVGYKKSYAEQRSKLVLDNILVKEAIRRIQANSKANTAITVEKVQLDLLDVQARSKESNDRSAELRAIELLGKTIAAFTDNLNTADISKQQELTEQERAEALKIAEIRLRTG